MTTFIDLRNELILLASLVILFLICAKISEKTKGNLMPIIGVIIISFFTVFVFDLLLKTIDFITVA